MGSACPVEGAAGWLAQGYRDTKKDWQCSLPVSHTWGQKLRRHRRSTGKDYYNTQSSRVEGTLGRADAEAVREEQVGLHASRHAIQ